MDKLTNKNIILLLVIIFIFKLIYSFTNEFWYPTDDDVIQIYLIGLKFLTTGEFPFFGADVVYTHSQILGGLQGILVAALWFVIRIPEAPQIFLNILLFISSLFLVWYLKKRVPGLPYLFLILWVMLIPWSVCYFTRVINPSYVVPGAILFFIGIYEIFPFLSREIIPKKWAFFFIGFSFFWIFQLHLSFFLLIPYLLLALYYLIKNGTNREKITNLAFFAMGCILTGFLILPALIIFGTRNNQGGFLSNIQLHFEHLKYIFDYITKFFSYGSYDITRFIGVNTEQRLNFLMQYKWTIPSVAILVLIGIAQEIFLVISFFRKKNLSFKWNGVRFFTLSLLIIMIISSVFSVAIPGGHSTTLLFPAVIIYSIHCFEFLYQKKYFKIIFYSSFLLAVIMYIGMGIENYYTISLYKNREPIVKALEKNDYRILGKRRYEK
jgi:hypothetical protein